MKKMTLFLGLLLLTFSVNAQDPTVYITNGGNGYSVIEGNSYEFTISMYSVTSTDVTVDVVTVSDTANNSDYSSINTTVTIPAGQLSSPVISITTTNDSTIENNEYFVIEATVTSGNTNNTETNRSILLYDNDTTPTLSVNQTPTLIEGQNSLYYITLSNYFSSDVTMDITTTYGTAGAADVTPTNTSLIIPADTRTSIYQIITLEDTLVEPDETYTITITVTSGNVTNPNIPVTVTIFDNDTTPTFSIRTSTSGTIEGSGAYVTAALDRVFNADVVVQFTSSNGSADNSDYTDINQSYVIEAGSRFEYFQIPTTDDTLDEPEETFNVSGTVTSGNATNTSATNTVTIIDNDGLPDIRLIPSSSLNNQSVNSGPNIQAEEGYPLRFFPRLSHVSPIDTEITVTTTNGSADASDYTTSTLTTTIPAGLVMNGSDELSYPTILDQLDEADENLFITATITSGNTFNTTVTEEAFIIDNYAINAQPDEVVSILEVGTTFQILDNDTFEGLPVIPSNTLINFGNTNTIGVTISPTGVLTVPVNHPQGNYYFDYEICETSDPTSCDFARITIIVESPLDVSFTTNYVDFNGDGFVSVGDTIEFEYTVTNNGNAVITDIDAEILYQDLDVVGGPLASLNPGETDTTTFTALHVLTQDDINFGYFIGDQEGGYFYGTYYGYEVIDYLYDPNQSFQLQQSDGLKLNAFIDDNANGSQDPGEINIPYPLGTFEYEINSDGVIHNLYASPQYLYESNPITSYDISFVVDSDYATVINSSSSYSGITVPTGSGITELNFPITVTPYDDLSIDLSSNGNLPVPVPGFTYWNTISFRNNSNEIESGTINFTMDDALNLIDVYDISSNWYTINPASYSTTATGFSFNFTNLGPFQQRTLWVKMSVPTLPTVSLGQLVTNSVDITLLPGDILPLNNTSSLTQTIVGSYDPNDITERHGPEIVHSGFSTEDYLTYTIRFENTGTANAINIRVENLLDEQLDETTLRMVSSSHDYVLERVGNQLEWNFYGIQLPPSEGGEDSTVGHGYITYEIKPLPDYAVGDIIPNTAEIYFDFNPPIITNTWNTEFVEDNLSIDDNSFENLKVYPNPVDKTIYISNNSIIDKVEITSLIGRKIWTKNLETMNSTIDVTTLSDGVYFITIESLGKRQTLKFIKK